VPQSRRALYVCGRRSGTQEDRPLSARPPDQPNPTSRFREQWTLCCSHNQRNSNSPSATSYREGLLDHDIPIITAKKHAVHCNVFRADIDQAALLLDEVRRMQIVQRVDDVDCNVCFLTGARMPDSRPRDD
jgi:hypothetical protein